jgi:hypothetical protein
MEGFADMVSVLFAQFGVPPLLRPTDTRRGFDCSVQEAVQQPQNTYHDDVQGLMLAWNQAQR